MWILALGGVFLTVSQACIFCRLPAHDLPDRLAQLNSQMKAQWKEWTSPDFSAFALGGSTILYNCSTCEGMETSCWPRKRCLPGSHDLREARILLFSVSGAVLLLGALSLLVE
ncbi:Transmembrane protein 95 [Sciurus carolinensis]|uniref:Transmembrane protein 95 n=1 Tax=Sciurus carolinensis TaxID=30640 RepID=A0AA41NDL8_SCICA|nr:Transmembrane protein 95 [Sciurus carolinensis]